MKCKQDVVIHENFSALVTYLCFGYPIKGSRYIVEYNLLVRIRYFRGRVSYFDFLTNQKRESPVLSLLIGRNIRPFPENAVLYRVRYFRIFGEGSQISTNEKRGDSAFPLLIETLPRKYSIL